MKVFSKEQLMKTTLFVGCTLFVTFKGYRCLIKFLLAPQSNHISYKSNALVSFPSISICPNEKYRFEELKKCQLSEGVSDLQTCVDFLALPLRSCKITVFQSKLVGQKNKNSNFCRFFLEVQNTPDTFLNLRHL